MKTQTGTFYNKMFFFASLWNIAIAFTGFFFYEFCLSLFFPENIISHDFLTLLFFRLFMIAILTYGAGYYFVSKELSLNRGIIWLGLISKLILFFVFTVLFIQGKATWIAFAALCGDFIWSVFFILFIVQSRPEVKINNVIG